MFTPRRGHSATVFGYGASFRVVVLFGGYMRGGFDSYIEGHFSETTLLLLGKCAIFATGLPRATMHIHYIAGP